MKKLQVAGQWFSTGRGFFFFFTGHLAAFEDIFGCYNWRNANISSGWKPGMLLNIPQCTEQLPITNNYLIKNVNNSKIEKPFLWECSLEMRPQRRDVMSQNHQISLRSSESQSSSPFCFYCWLCCTMMHLKVSGCWFLHKCSVSVELRFMQGEGWANHQ